jgi:hypothetical protein
MTRRWAGGATEDQIFHSFFTGVLGNAIQPMNGIKGGNTPNAKGTGLFSAGLPGRGDALVTTFYTPDGSGNHYIDDAAYLMQLGARECDFDFAYAGNVWEPYYFADFPTCDECVEGRALELQFGPPGDLVFDAHRTVGEGVQARIEMNHILEAEVPSDGAIEIGIGPFESRSEVVIHNMGTTAAEVLFVPSAGGTAIPLTIPAAGRVTVPPYASPAPLAQYTATIADNGGVRVGAFLSIETTYAFEVDAAPLAGSAPVLSVELRRDPGLINDNLSLRVVGRDPAPGGRLWIVGHEPGAVVGVDPDGEPVLSGESGAVSAISAGPNPFVKETTLRFTLERDAIVRAEIFDATGRLVRSAPEQALRAGAWSIPWSGEDDRGIAVPAGVYFYRIDVDGKKSEARKVVRIE